MNHTLAIIGGLCVGIGLSVLALGALVSWVAFTGKF